MKKRFTHLSCVRIFCNPFPESNLSSSLSSFQPNDPKSKSGHPNGKEKKDKTKRRRKEPVEETSLSQYGVHKSPRSLEKKVKHCNLKSPKNFQSRNFFLYLFPGLILFLVPFQHKMVLPSKISLFQHQEGKK